MSLAHHRIVFAGCVRDGASQLPAVLANVSALASHVPQSAFVFVENDSKDASANILSNFCAGQSLARLLSLDGIGKTATARTVRLATARNAIVSCVRQWSELNDFDTLVMLDMDDINSMPWNMSCVLDCLNWLHADPEAVGVFANQLNRYYDMWALREPSLCPGDIWEDTFDAAMADQLDDASAFAQVVAPRLFSLPQDAAPVEVDSAFGGLGMYKLRAVRHNPIPYCGESSKVWGAEGQMRIARWQRCEHVSFHLGLRLMGGRLFIRPDLINADCSGLELNPSACRAMSF